MIHLFFFFQNLTYNVPTDVLHPACVVVMPVCDDDLLDACVELLQCLFEISDVFRHTRFSSVYQHPPAIKRHKAARSNF